MTNQIYKLPIKTLRAFMKEVFLKLGAPKKDAEICADVLISADLRGIDSHGIQRLKMYYNWIKSGILLPKANFKVVRETPTTLLINGNNGMGPVIACHSMQMVIKKAKKHGIAAAAVFNSNHYGIAGYYALMAVKEGLIGLAMTNARPAVAPTFGVEPMFGTNAIAFGAPTDQSCPFLFDAATSLIQRGKIEVLQRAGKPTPKRWVIDQNGNPFTDTTTILKNLFGGTAALLPLGGNGEFLGGHKGYGLAILVEILCASLQNGQFLKGLSGLKNRKEVPHRRGHFFLSINIGSFIPLKKFKKTTAEILRQLRNSRKIPGHKRIYTAGEKEWMMEKIRRKEGVPINPDLQKDIKIMQKELGLSQYNFPF